MVHCFVCHACGALNEYEKRCPNPGCKGFCAFCKKSGHLIDKCPKLFCNHCHTQGHKTSQCPKQSSGAIRQKPTQTKPARYHPYDSPKTNPPKPKPKSIPTSTTPASISQELKCQIDQYQSLGDTSHTFPDLRCVLGCLLDQFGLGRTTELWQTMYCDLVKRLGGPKKVEDLLFGFIGEDIKALQGQLITAQRLQEVKRAQPVTSEQDWWQSGGYLDFITDDRDVHHQRYYVGQSTKLAFRIRQHISAMLYGHTSTLHYYIHALGGGHRKPNFIRLFCVSESVAT